MVSVEVSPMFPCARSVASQCDRMSLTRLGRCHCPHFARREANITGSTIRSVHQIQFAHHKIGKYQVGPHSSALGASSNGSLVSGAHGANSSPLSYARGPPGRERKINLRRVHELGFVIDMPLDASADEMADDLEVAAAHLDRAAHQARVAAAAARRGCRPNELQEVVLAEPYSSQPSLTRAMVPTAEHPAQGGLSGAGWSVTEEHSAPQAAILRSAPTKPAQLAAVDTTSSAAPLTPEGACKAEAVRSSQVAMASQGHPHTLMLTTAGATGALNNVALASAAKDDNERGSQASQLSEAPSEVSQLGELPTRSSTVHRVCDVTLPNEEVTLVTASFSELVRVLRCLRV